MSPAAHRTTDRFTARMFRGLWVPAMLSSLGWALSDMADAVVVGQRLGAVLHRKVGLSPDGDAGRSACIGRLLPFLLQGCRHGVDQLRLAVAGVHRELGDAQVAHLAAGNPGEVEGFFIGLLLSGREGQANITNQDHILSYFLSCTAPHSCPAQRSCRWRAHRGGRRCSAGRWRRRSRRRRSQ